MAKMSVRHSWFKDSVHNRVIPTVVVSDFRLRGDECKEFVRFLREQGMHRRADMVAVAVDRATEERTGIIGGGIPFSPDFEAQAKRIAERYDEEVETIKYD